MLYYIKKLCLFKTFRIRILILILTLIISTAQYRSFVSPNVCMYVSLNTVVTFFLTYR